MSWHWELHDFHGLAVGTVSTDLWQSANLRVLLGSPLASTCCSRNRNRHRSSVDEASQTQRLDKMVEGSLVCHKAHRFYRVSRSIHVCLALRVKFCHFLCHCEAYLHPYY